MGVLVSVNLEGREIARYDNDEMRYDLSMDKAVLAYRPRI